MSQSPESPLLAIRDLQVRIGPVRAVRGVSLEVRAGECLSLVGESGCGKSMTAMSLMGLLPRQAQLSASDWHFDTLRPGSFSARQWQQFRGEQVAMIFQNPMTALNPTMRIGAQITEPLRAHRGMSRKQAQREVERLLERMSITNAAYRARQYPFEFSGGMLQRVMIAAALACEPRLLIADEPTTALDVTVQAEVLALLDELRRERNMALLLITHDLGVVARMADRVAVMYAGEIVEEGSAEQLFYHTAHPYTEALRASVPTLSHGDRLPAIAGTPPDLRSEIGGCAFMPRCAYAMDICRETPAYYPLEAGHCSRCWRWHPDCPQRGLGAGDHG